MFKNINDLKDFIVWCKKEKVRAITIEDITVELSEVAMVEDIIEKPSVQIKSKPYVATADTSPFVDKETVDPSEDEETLFWSSNT